MTKQTNVKNGRKVCIQDDTFAYLEGKSDRPPTIIPWLANGSGLAAGPMTGSARNSES
jgi:hypothetical protein